MKIFQNSTSAKRRDLLLALYNKNPMAFTRVLAVTQNPVLGEVAAGTEQAINTAADSETWFDKILKAASAVGLVLNQREINKINLERVKQGLEPLSTDVTGQAVNIGIAAETRKVLVYTALGLGALLAIVLLARKR